MKNFNWSKYSKPIILVAFVIILSVLKPAEFLSVSNFISILTSVAAIGIMVSGTIFVFLIGGIDLSIATLLSMSAVVAATVITKMGGSAGAVIIGLIAALFVGALAGLLHGYITTTFAIPAFLVTFATQSIFLGGAQVLSNNNKIACTWPAFAILGKAVVPIIFMAVFALVSWYVLRRTVFGRYVYAVGGNPTASEISGINVKLVSIMCYVISGFTTAMGGIILAAQSQQADSALGAGFTNDVITAAVIGGISLLGGEGTLPGAIFGAVLMGLLNNGLSLMNVDSTQSGLVKGLVIVVAVAFDAMHHADQSRKKAKKVKKAAAAPELS